MATFPEKIRAMRLQLFGKQVGAAARLGCTDAAISYWESGSRLPSPKLMGRLVECLEQAGARPEDLSELLVSYRQSVLARRERELPVGRYGAAGKAQ
jgi:transcriptional regulator with XRE-family HTH domain